MSLDACRRRRRLLGPRRCCELQAQRSRAGNRRAVANRDVCRCNIDSSVGRGRARGEGSRGRTSLCRLRHDRGRRQGARLGARATGFGARGARGSLRRIGRGDSIRHFPAAFAALGAPTRLADPARRRVRGFPSRRFLRSRARAGGASTPPSPGQTYCAQHDGLLRGGRRLGRGRQRNRGTISGRRAALPLSQAQAEHAREPRA